MQKGKAPILRNIISYNQKGVFMQSVKQKIHYWCQDTIIHQYLGQGITAAVLDTGIAPHFDFAGRIIAFQDMINGRSRIYDDSGHGTHVCGILAGDGGLSGGVMSGIAPKCNLVVMKVLDERGDGNVSHVLKAIDWIVKYKERYRIRIVNISVGTLPHRQSKAEKELLQGVERLWDEGLVVVTAAGNYGPAKGSITVPGNSPKVITVGSSDDQIPLLTKGTRKNYSGRGPTRECICKPEVVAPGSNIWSCNAFYVQKHRNAYVRKSGTSMSTPIVSGAIACMLSKYPDMSNVEVKLRLWECSDDVGMDYCVQGWGQVNVERLLTV